MIPTSRRVSSKTFGRTLMSYSRQSLPRPARFYSTPTKRIQAPALATAPAPVSDDFPAFMHKQEPSPSSSNTGNDNVQSFLRRRTPFTFIPAPLPDDMTSPLNDYYFPDSPTQDKLAVIDACLHNCYDVPRANYVFSQLRQNRRGDPILQPRLYNLFLEAYLEMALEKDQKDRKKWLDEAWTLYEDMEGGVDNVAPISGTYATMLKIWMRTSTTDVESIASSSRRSPADLLRCILNRQVSVTTVISEHCLTSEEAMKAVQHLSRAAAQLGLSHVISELGQAEAIAADPLADVPEVRPVLQQTVEEDGTPGSKSMPFNLENLRKHLAEVAYARRVLPDDVAARQKLLEASVYDVAVHRLRHEAEKLDELGLNQGILKNAVLQKWMYDWHERLQRRLTAEIAMIIEEERALKVNRADTAIKMRMGPFLSLLKPQKLSLITILELMRLQGTGGVQEGMKTARALLTVGKTVEMEHKAEVLKKNNIQLPAGCFPMGNRPGDVSYFTSKAYKELQEWRTSAASFVEQQSEWTSEWTHAVRARVGSFLVDCLMDVATVKRTAIDKKTGEEISEEQPAFFHSYEYIRGHKLGVIRLNPVVAERLSRDDIRSTLHPRHLPMLIKPKPWLSHDNGGYIYNKSSVMRLKDTQEQLTYLRHACAQGHVELIFASLDVLGSTPWQINRPIFDIVLEVWNNGDRFSKIPPAVFDMPEPVKPEDYETNPQAKAAYINQWRMWNKDKANNHSDRCSVNYRVEIARAFLSDTFYLPHNIDFRGRSYPIPPHLNHIGNDLSRGLLKFAEAKPLGKSGLRWLKIHLANLYGFDKGSFEERVQFVEKNLEEIYDSAEKPLEGRQWWTKADDPWQCLSACMELRAALESLDPESFESSLPVHQDGTCNGLQHYAALGGDIKGAKQVNLDVGDRPADVYTHVADMVEEQLKVDVAKGDKYAQMLLGKVARKVVKQTVMTTVYGVTYIGARAQIEKQLRDRGDIEANETWAASSYLAKKVIGCIGDLFAGARDIQHWLTLSARLIAKSIPCSRVEDWTAETASQVKDAKKYRGRPRGPSRGAPVMTLKRLPKEQMTTVVWTTPLGLPIVQPYRKIKRKQIVTSIQSVFISDPNSPAEVNATKQASAFPPNFIHSLDATHMMLTALECRKNDITFASVHDSYWTHAATIDSMNTIIRDTFIALHESNVLGKLQREFLERYKDYKVPLASIRSSTMQKKLKLPLDVMNSLAAEKAAIEGSDLDEVTQASVEELDSAEEALSADAEFAEEVDEEAALQSKAVPKHIVKKVKEEDDTPLISRFVDLVDILPPLPKKGDFDVKTIRKSLYFFS